MTDGGPHRTCVGCRSTRPRSDLIRFRRDDNGVVRVLPGGGGRGAWICADTVPSCLERASSSSAFARAFRRPVTDIEAPGDRERH